jgi:BON domain
MVTGSLTRRVLPAGLLAGSLLIATGCKQFLPSAKDEAPKPAAAPAAAPAPAPRSDQDIANDVQNRINAESALSGQNIQVGVNGGTVTLNGSVNNEAARALAAADSGAANGVKTVINNLTVTPERAQKQEPPKPERHKKAPRPAAQEQAMNEPAPAPPPAQPAPQAAPAPPPPPPKPVVRTVSIDSGTSLPVRIAEGLDSSSAQTGQAFHGTLAADIIVDNMIAIPRGTQVTGRVAEAKDAAHFAGSSLLSLELTAVLLNGQSIPLSTTQFSQQGKGRGKNTAAKTGGGAAIGAIIGALAGGGKGAAIGAASGGGIGAGVNAVTRGEQVKIAPETLINFKLQAPVSVSTSRSANGAGVQTYNDDSSQPQ